MRLSPFAPRPTRPQRRISRSPATVLVLAIAAALPAASGCARVDQGAGGSGAQPDGGGGSTSDAARDLLSGQDLLGGGGPPSPDAGPPPMPIDDFPPNPIVVPPAPANAGTLFETTPRTSGAPCVLSPEPGTLMPRNWLRPLIQAKPTADENLFEIKVTVASFAHALTVYTTEPSYKMERDLWNGLRYTINDQPITVTVRALTLSSSGTVQNPPSPPATSDFTIAPVDAPGKIVYWANPGGSTSGDGFLRGFGVGEEGVADVLHGTQVSAAARDTVRDTCIGCHTATPDGLAVGFVFGPPTDMIGLDTYYNTVTDIQQGSAGAVPPYVAPEALTAVRALRGIPSFSKGHWSDGDRIVLLTDANNMGTLIWVGLDTAGAQGVLARTGDPGGATEPSFSHDGSRVVYVSSPTTGIHDGRLDKGPADLFVVPYASGAGGGAKALAGAADGTNTHFYPSFSPDDAYVAYTYAAGAASAYSNPASEIFVVSSDGGQASRFGANDPPKCSTSGKSPGITNDWPKWSPAATTGPNGVTYYWVTFSSTRTGTPQLYVAPMTRSGATVKVAYPALYLWNQPPSEHNHTPSWDSYQIPPIVIE